VAGEIPKVPVVPGRLDTVEDPWRVAHAVPADPEPVAVGRLRTEPGVEALVDQRMLRLQGQFLDQPRKAGVGKPAAHRRPFASGGRRWRCGGRGLVLVVV